MHVDEIIGDPRCSFWPDKSTFDHIFCLYEIREEKWEYSGAVHQLFVDLNESL